MGATYLQLLAAVPEGLRFLIPVVCGNDFYGNAVKPLSDGLREASNTFCAEAQRVSKTQFAVLGMSATTWRYDTWMSEDSYGQYDANCCELVDVFKTHGIFAELGADQLEGLTLADWIGHVDPSSERTVFNAY